MNPFRYCIITGSNHPPPKQLRDILMLGLTKEFLLLKSTSIRIFEYIIENPIAHIIVDFLASSLFTHLLIRHLVYKYIHKDWVVLLFQLAELKKLTLLSVCAPVHLFFFSCPWQLLAILTWRSPNTVGSSLPYLVITIVLNLEKSNRVCSTRAGDRRWSY